MALVTGALNDWLIAKNYLTITSSRKIFVAFGEFTVQFCTMPVEIAVARVHNKFCSF